MKTAWSIEVWHKPEVTDPVEESIIKGVGDLGIQTLKSAKSGQKYTLEGGMTRDQVERICKELLANPVIQTYKIQRLSGRRS